MPNYGVRLSESFSLPAVPCDYRLSFVICIVPASFLNATTETNIACMIHDYVRLL